MFHGQAEEAMRFYVSIFRRAEVGPIERWGPGQPGTEGSIKQAHLALAGHRIRFFDSPVRHDFTFTPAVSFFVECEDDVELSHAYEQLSLGGQVLMPLGEYGFSRRFGWVNDRFGVSWQLNLE
jgi:predicted 3-demethylubiquinone-9 3-methyltransferase (glyoxalase superfamily)